MTMNTVLCMFLNLISDTRMSLISLLEKNYDIKSIEGLFGKSIMSFQRAKNILARNIAKRLSTPWGVEKLQNRKRNCQRFFIVKRKLLSWMLISSNTYIKNSPQFDEKCIIHPIFGEYYYSAGFKTAELKQLFDAGINQIKSDGIYQEILDKYPKK